MTVEEAQDKKAVECLLALQIVKRFLDEEEDSTTGNSTTWIDKRGRYFRGDIGYLLEGLDSFKVY